MKMLPPPHEPLFVMLYDKFDEEGCSESYHHGYYGSIEEAAEAFYGNFTGQKDVVLVGIAQVVAYPESRWDKDWPNRGDTTL